MPNLTLNEYSKGSINYLEYNFSDNPYLIRFSSDDMTDVMRVKSTLEARISNHFNGDDDLITSDIEKLEYIKKVGLYE